MKLFSYKYVPCCQVLVDEKVAGQVVHASCYLHCNVQEVSMVQAGLNSAVLIAAAADVRVWRAHDQELMEISEWEELEEHAHRLLLCHHAQETHNIRMVELCKYRSLLLEFVPLLWAGEVLQSLDGHKLSMLHTWQVQVTFVDFTKGALTQLLHETYS